jgi:hypothetical protein
MSFTIEISNETLTDANTLRNNSTQKRKIKEEVVSILKKINEEIKDAHRIGKHIIITDIPIVFDIPNMDNKSAQRSVWANVVEILKYKNYRVWINPSKNHCQLKITWLSSDDELHIKNQTKILADSTYQF